MPDDLSPAAAAVLDLLSTSGGVTTFAAVIDELEAQGIPSSGNFVLTAATDPNLVLWAGCSDELMGAVRGLLSAGRIHFGAAPVVAYVVAGTTLTLPLAHPRPAGTRYASARWFPAFLRSGPGGERSAVRPVRELVAS